MMSAVRGVDYLVVVCGPIFVVVRSDDEAYVIEGDRVLLSGPMAERGAKVEVGTVLSRHGWFGDAKDDKEALEAARDVHRS
jgi:hypothetical protein